MGKGQGSSSKGDGRQGSQGEQQWVERNQRYFPTTEQELEGARWHQQALEHERERAEERKAAVEIPGDDRDGWEGRMGVVMETMPKT